MPFSKELSVGNRILDSEHKKLHGIIDRMTHSIAARDITTLLKTFDLLENGLYDYFAVEENIAQAVNFDFSLHRLAHQDLLRKFQIIRNAVTDKNGIWCKYDERGCINSLKNCLIQHIKEDESLRVVLDTYLYDFKPDCVNVAPALSG